MDECKPLPLPPPLPPPAPPLLPELPAKPLRAGLAGSPAPPAVTCAMVGTTEQLLS